MAPTDRLEFVCNICGTQNTRKISEFEREEPSCGNCQSSVRARAIIHMLSRELFGADLTLPDFPRVKAIKGIGLSDFCYDQMLADRLGYTNTFYHKEPSFDILKPGPVHESAYDFLISSEVFEHVAPPAGRAFEAACRVLKPNGILFLTVPYTLREKTAEHFPELYDYGLAKLRDRVVLVNRTRSGELQTFEDLCFHGGDGSTLEMRVFTESDLRRIIAEAGFASLEIYSENVPKFGIVRTENWSLPIAARKLPYSLPVAAASEVMEGWLQRSARIASLEKEYTALKAKFEEYHAWAEKTMGESEAELQARAEWARGLERLVEERTTWAKNLDHDLASHQLAYTLLKNEHEERTEWALKLEAELKVLRAELERLRAQRWIRAGRKFGMVE